MSSPKLRLIFRPKSEIQTFFLPKIRWSPKKKKKKKKKKKVFTNIETDFSAGFVTFRSVGGDASRNVAELFKIRADFSAKIVTFRLVGGDASPPSPPLNPPLHRHCLESTFPYMRGRKIYRNSNYIFFLMLHLPGNSKRDLSVFESTYATCYLTNTHGEAS